MQVYSPQYHAKSYSTSSRITGLLLIIVPALLMYLSSGWIFTTHPAWQRQMTAVTLDVTPHHDVAPHYEDITVKVAASQYTQTNALFSLYGWRGDQGGGATIKVWALLGTDQTFGNQVVAVAQDPWPHQYHWVRIFLFCLLCCMYLICALSGLYLLLRR